MNRAKRIYIDTYNNICLNAIVFVKCQILSESAISDYFKNKI